MPRQESEEEEDAAPEPGFSTQTKAIRNDGAAHAESDLDSDAKRMETESGPNVEKHFDESTGNLA